MSPPKAKSAVLECIALRPTEEEAAVIWEACKEIGLEPCGESVLKLLMLFLCEEEEHPSRSPVFQYFKAHPEELGAIKEAAVKTAGMLFQKLVRR